MLSILIFVVQACKFKNEIKNKKMQKRAYKLIRVTFLFANKETSANIDNLYKCARPIAQLECGVLESKNYIHLSLYF